MSEKVVVCYPGAALRPLEKRFQEVRFAFFEDVEKALAEAQDGTVFICSGRTLTAAVAPRLLGWKDLRWIQLASAGFEKMGGVEIPPRIRITRGGGIYDVAVAEHALALILALQRRLTDAVRNQQEGRWGIPYEAFETVAEKRVTILGFGEIGRALAARTLAMGAQVTGVSRNPAPMTGVAVRTVTELHDILPQTDILVAVLPGGAATAGMIGTRELGLLPAGAILINVGRGDSLDSDALRNALESGRLRGAGLDVTDPEPLPPGHPLWANPRVLITPHVAGRDSGQPKRFLALVEGNLSRYLAGESLRYEIPR